jgi:ABC-type amino acid transport substrate-binding protein
MRPRRLVRVLLVGATAAALSCTGPTPSPPEPRPRPVVVGTSGDSPPYAMRRGPQLEGLDVDLASELGKALGRPIDIRDLPSDQLLEGLLSHRVDMVMAGMAVTPEREQRFAFGDPYLRTTIGALIRREDAKRFASPDAVCKGKFDVGLVAGTVGERYLRQHCPEMVARLYPKVSEAVLELRRHRIRAVAHDSPVLSWLLSGEEADLTVVPTRIADQRLAWAFRRGDDELRRDANAALADMRADGTLEHIVERWVPRQNRRRPR